MSITAAELQSNLHKYLALAATEEIHITQDGKVIAKLSKPVLNKVDIVRSLYGCIPADITLEEAREERLQIRQ